MWHTFDRLRGRWREPSLSILLAVQALVIFGLVPASASGLPLPQSATGSLLFVFMTLTVLMARGRWAPILGGAMLVAALLTGVLHVLAQGWPVRVAGEVSGLLTFLLLGIVVLRAVFGPGRFTNHRIRGSVVFYLNLGLMFAFVHRLVAELSPGAYDHLPPSDHVSAFRAALDYFSFATLTSLGYGDIVPVSPAARSLCTFEAALGQLLPTLLIARVVAISIQQEGGNEDKHP